MALFQQDIMLPKWFGDFGGDLSTGDLDERPARRAGEIQSLLPGAAFEEEFGRVLALVRPQPPAVRRQTTAGGRTLLCVPDVAWKYNLAGQLALARLRGVRHLCAGTFRKEQALAAAAACEALGLRLSLMLGRLPGADEALVRQLEQHGCEVDAQSCVQMFDLPHLYAPKLFSMEDPEVEAFPFAANYGDYPAPALAGALAGLYGKWLRARVGVPDVVAVPIADGTGAVGVLSAYIDEPCRCATVERPIAQEYHNGETLTTRAADNEEDNTVICPQLAHWWRSARVLRLGCDRFRPVDTSGWAGLGLSGAAARAAALADQAVPEWKTMMIVEGPA